MMIPVIPETSATQRRPPTLREQWGCIDQPSLQSWWSRFDVLDAFLFFSLFSFAYVYFYPYTEGVSQAPVVFFLLKYVVWGGVLALVLMRGGRYSIVIDGLPALVSLFAAGILLLHVVHLPQYVQLSDMIHLGNLLIFVPLVLLLRFEHVRRLYDWLPALMSLQVIVSVTAMGAGIELWEDGSLVGLFSNPNSFALALNLALFVVLSRRRAFTFIEMLQMSLLATGLVLSRSNSQLLIFVLGVAIIALATAKRRLWFVLALAGIVPAALTAAWVLGLIDTKVIVGSLLRLSELVGGTGDFTNQLSEGATPSGSVTLREQIHLFAWNFLQRASLPELLLGDFENTVYHIFDSQFLTVVVNYGLPCMAVFVWLLYVAFVVSWRKMKATGEWLDVLVWMAFAVTFLFSRVLYYFPVNLLFLAWLVHVSTPSRVVFIPIARRP